MNHKKRVTRKTKLKTRALAPLLLLCAFLPGCIIQAPVLTDEMIPAIVPDPLPEIRQSIAYGAMEYDALGEEIFDPATHYNRYVEFLNLRVFEYGGDTFLDGTCINGYPEPLYGAFSLLLKDKDGVVMADGTLLFDEDEHLIPPGETRLFATINTDMRVDQLPLTIVYDETVRPYTTPE